jgi:hypothetical protein
MLIDTFSQLVGHVCASAALAVVALLLAAWLRRFSEGLGATAADAADGE